MIKSCPFCGSSDIKMQDLIDRCYFYCNSCYADGPVGRSEDEAERLWNGRALDTFHVEAKK